MFEAKTIFKAKHKVKNLKIERVHAQALIASREYIKAEHVLFEIVCELDQYDVAAYYEYSSLYDYCVKALNLTEAVTCNMIAVARKSKQVPELKAAVMNGAVSVSTARKITPVISKENSQEWLSKATSLTKAKLEKAVATVKPKEAIYDSAKYVSAEILEIKFGLDEKVMQKFKRAQDLVSQKTKSAASFEKTLEVVLDFYLEKNDPLKKAERNVHKSKKEPSPSQKATSPAQKSSLHGDLSPQLKDNAGVENGMNLENVTNLESKEKLDIGLISEPVPGQARQQSQSLSTEPVPGQVQKPKRYIEARVQHQVRIRDQDQCTHRNQHGERCPNTRWLEVHHIQGFANGGLHNLDNLTTLCSSHHRAAHR